MKIMCFINSKYLKKTASYFSYVSYSSTSSSQASLVASLALVSLVGSLLVTGVSPSVADPLPLTITSSGPPSLDDTKGEPSYLPVSVACLGPASTERGFKDVSEGNVFKAAINCLAYYGITVGRGNNMFSPSTDVTRNQMVLFMTRTAKLARVNAANVISDFATNGKPSDLVTRAEMALLLTRLLIESTDRFSDYNVTVNSKKDSNKRVRINGSSDFGFFHDVRYGSPPAVDAAVSVIYELGVTKGRGDGSLFDPQGTVQRGAMAAFITRTLAHTRVRPAGLTAQVNRRRPNRITVSLRDDRFAPIEGKPVDLFSADLNRSGNIFTPSGECNTSVASNVNAALQNSTVSDNNAENNKICEIDVTDKTTNAYGDYLTTTIGISANGTNVWAWTSKLGAKIKDGKYSKNLFKVKLEYTDISDTRCPVVGGDVRVLSFVGGQPLCVDPGVGYVAVFDTSEGVMRFDLDVGGVLGTVNNFVTLARWGYYDETLLFRTDPSIDIIQGGSPYTQDASDPGPGYTIVDEPKSGFKVVNGQLVGPYRYKPGQLVMARSAGPDSAGAQFFITTGPKASYLNSQGTYVVFGETDEEGLEVAKSIMELHEPGGQLGGAPSRDVTVYSITIEETQPKKPKQKTQ